MKLRAKPWGDRMTDFETAEERNARVLATQVRTHPSYEAVKAAKGGREPSIAELNEHAEGQAFAGLTKAQKIAGMLDDILDVARNQVKHGGPVPPFMITELEAIRSLLT